MVTVDSLIFVAFKFATLVRTSESLNFKGVASGILCSEISVICRNISVRDSKEPRESHVIMG